MSAQNPLFPPLPSGDGPIFDRWLSDTLGSGTPNWDRLWFFPGRVPQSAELNEMQSMMWTYLGRVCNTILGEGQVISGLVPTFSGTTVSITAGFMFIQGRIRPIASGTATITGVGTETVGLLYTNTTLIPQTDAELMNPVTTVIVGPQQYSLLGAGRMSMTFAWASNSGAANYVVIYTYVNGVLQQSPFAVHSPYVFVPYTATPIFNCAQGTPTLVVFQITLTGNVTSSTVTNLSPGQTVKFIITTDGSPGHTFVWPTGNISGTGTLNIGDSLLGPLLGATNYLQVFTTTGAPSLIAESGLIINP